MMKPKFALVKDGFLPPGSENKRGRLSAAGDARCKELAAMGWQIEGYQVASAPVATTATDAAPAAPVVTKVKADPSAIEELVPMTRDERAVKGYTSNGSVGMRTVCNICRCSLTHCPCEQPRVWLDFDREAMVYFKPIKASGG